MYYAIGAQPGLSPVGQCGLHETILNHVVCSTNHSDEIIPASFYPNGSVCPSNTILMGNNCYLFTWFDGSTMTYQKTRNQCELKNLKPSKMDVFNKFTVLFDAVGHNQSVFLFVRIHQ